MSVGDPPAAAFLARWDELRNSLLQLSGSQDRLSWLVARTHAAPRLDPADRTEAHRVPGCLSPLWCVALARDGRCWFRTDSDSRIVRALGGLVSGLFDGLSPDEVLAAPPVDLEALGLGVTTVNRRDALSRLETRLRDFARSLVTCGSAPP